MANNRNWSILMGEDAYKLYERLIKISVLRTCIGETSIYNFNKEEKQMILELLDSNDRQTQDLGIAIYRNKK